jgi:hypothetical protein
MNPLWRHAAGTRTWLVGEVPAEGIERRTMDIGFQPDTSRRIGAIGVQVLSRTWVFFDDDSQFIEDVQKYSWACHCLPRAAAYSEMRSSHKPTAGPPGNPP